METLVSALGHMGPSPRSMLEHSLLLSVDFQSFLIRIDSEYSKMQDARRGHVPWKTARLSYMDTVDQWD
jgi:hypothetical protein